MALSITTETTVEILSGDVLSAGATSPPLRVRITNGDEPAVERTDVNRIIFEMEKRHGDPVGGTAELGSDPGVIKYRWRDGETDARGVYRGRFTLVGPTGEEVAVPVERPLTVNIV